MNPYRVLAVGIVLAVLTPPAPAGWLFGRRNAKTDPNERVTELLATVKNDGDESHRENAAEELRHFDASANPNIIPTLVDVLTHDTKPAVRAEAAATLGRLRPVSQQAGWALEQALAKDPSLRVRLQARSSLMHYYMAGYHGGKNQEPPPAENAQTPPAGNTTPSTKNVTNTPSTTNTTNPTTTTTLPQTGPPAAQPRLKPTPVETPPRPPAQPAPAAPSTAPVPQPLPKGPPNPPLVPADPPQLQPPPLPSPPSSDDRKDDQGPDLTPPPK
jgi:hypothetical protein